MSMALSKLTNVMDEIREIHETRSIYSLDVIEMELYKELLGKRNNLLNRLTDEEREIFDEMYL